MVTNDNSLFDETIWRDQDFTQHWNTFRFLKLFEDKPLRNYTDRSIKIRLERDNKKTRQRERV